MEKILYYILYTKSALINECKRNWSPLERNINRLLALFNSLGGIRYAGLVVGSLVTMTITEKIKNVNLPVISQSSLFLYNLTCFSFLTNQGRRAREAAGERHRHPERTKRHGGAGHDVLPGHLRR